MRLSDLVDLACNDPRYQDLDEGREDTKLGPFCHEPGALFLGSARSMIQLFLACHVHPGSRPSCAGPPCQRLSGRFSGHMPAAVLPVDWSAAIAAGYTAVSYAHWWISWLWNGVPNGEKGTETRSPGRTYLAMMLRIQAQDGQWQQGKVWTTVVAPRGA